MAARRKPKAREAQLAFEALSIEGGLLSPEWLSRVAQLQAGTQTEADYRIPKGLNLRDEIGRHWRIAQAYWAELKAGREAKADPRGLAQRFVASLLREAFGFTSLAEVAPLVVSERSYPIGHAALAGRVPVIIAPLELGLDMLSPAFGDGGRRRSAFGLAQEYLNAQEGALWGLACDGASLRILRDNASLTRPACLEADLQRIFTEERYADFAALWLLAHETRFGREGLPVTECALEAWRNAGREEGTKARDKLRFGVEEALVALGQGFVSHPDNQALRGALQTGALSTKDYQTELLRLIYRLIFLLTVEERGLLHPEGASDAAKALYAQGYSLRRLRERSVKRSAHDRFSDLWEATKIVFRGLASGEPHLALPALAGIFAPGQCKHIDASKLENRALLLAVFKLAWLREDDSLARVNWRDMGPEELGSVYESLLELVPQITKDGRQFAFAVGSETKGNARKTTGSYYTPDSLVQVLLDSALDPVIADTIARNPGREVEALLSLSVVDPACGSGHFLLAAARRLAAHVARLQANGTPSATEYRRALRQVVGRCIYGVDLNPMAVELCKVSLWMEAVEPGLPLTFLNSHVQHGNALLGTTPELMAKGIPDTAWEPIEGDDKKTASTLKKRNKKAAEGQRSLDTLWSEAGATESRAVARAVAALESAGDASAEALARKESQWDDILNSDEYRHQKFIADAWCATFVWPKQPGEFADAAPTNELWRQLRDNQGQPPALTAKTANDLAKQYQFFHWHLQFPQVFAKAGFDVVLGNPPWDKIQLEEQQFFAASHPEIAGADARRRKRLIEELQSSDPHAFATFRATLRRSLGTAQIVKESGRYELTGRGNVATHALFLEASLRALAPRPSAALGLVVPSGLATQDSQKELFAFLVNGRLRCFFDFENSEGLFPSVDSRFRFALVSAVGAVQGIPARFSFFLRSTAELSEHSRILTISGDHLKSVSPNTRSAPLARTQRELDVFLRICRAGIALKPDEGPATWGWQSSQMFNETHEADLLVASGTEPAKRDANQLTRLYEAKLIHQFDHRFSTYDDERSTRYVTASEHDDASFFTRTRWLVPAHVWAERVAPRNSGRSWVLAFRRIARGTDERTFIAAVLPRCGAGSQTPIATVTTDPISVACLLGNLNTFVFDFGVRLRSGGTDLNHFIVNQLFVVPPARYAETKWQSTAETIRRIVLELTYTAWDLESFANDIGYHGPPFRWIPERRFMLRCELDAAFFHLYGLSRDDTDHVMNTFPLVRKNDEKAHEGKYRTKDTILEIYDLMAEAARTGRAYRTRLPTPPADPSVAHPLREGGSVIPLRPGMRPQPTTQPAAVPPSNPRREVPAWSPELLPAVAAKTGLAASPGRWGITLTGVDLGIATLAAVLRNMSSPASREEVERAVVLCVLPGLLRSKFDAQTAPNWRRAIGPVNMKLTSIASLSIPWAEVLRRAAVEHLLVIDADGRWRAGAHIKDAPSAVLDARALVSLSWLESVSGAAVEDAELIAQLGVLRAA